MMLRLRSYHTILCMRGGIGNQLYQYAALEAIKSFTGMSACIDLSHYKYRNNPRKPLLLCLAKKIRHSLDNVSTWPTIFAQQKLCSVNKDLYSFMNLRPIVEDSDIILESLEVKNFSKPHLLIGYFQHHRFISKSNMMTSFERYCRKTVGNSRNVIGIHLRLGDYSDPNYSGLYWIANRKYINEAYSIVCTRLQGNTNYEVRIFSDDIKKATSLIESTDIDLRKVKFISLGSAIEDLMQLASCEYKILGNSTYSMISHYLNKDASFTVIPRSWFKTQETPASLFPHTDARVLLLNNQ